jgi:hypothetical protein
MCNLYSVTTNQEATLLRWRFDDRRSLIFCRAKIDSGDQIAAKFIQKSPKIGLAISHERSGTVVNPRRLGRSEILPRRLDRRGGASVVRREAVINGTEDLNGKACEEAITSKI